MQRGNQGVEELDILGMPAAAARPEHVAPPSSNLMGDNLFSESAPQSAQGASPDIEALFGNAPAQAQV